MSNCDKGAVTNNYLATRLRLRSNSEEAPEVQFVACRSSLNCKTLSLYKRRGKYNFTTQLNQIVINYLLDPLYLLGPANNGKN